MRLLHDDHYFYKFDNNRLLCRSMAMRQKGIELR